VIGIRGRPRPTRDVDDVLGPEDLRAVFTASDAIVLCAPLVASTRRLVNETSLRWLKPGAVLVNVGRGGLVDESALRAALRQGRLRGAALDVFEHEPLPVDDPLYETPGLLMTPHVSAWSEGHDERMVALFADNLRRFEHGEPLQNEFDPALGY
jgi:phosphoglycerate dehydrogenase-like enzyme